MHNGHWDAATPRTCGGASKDKDFEVFSPGDQAETRPGARFCWSRADRVDDSHHGIFSFYPRRGHRRKGIPISKQEFEHFVSTTVIQSSTIFVPDGRRGTAGFAWAARGAVGVDKNSFTIVSRYFE
jgi:hypothetical protein